MNASLLQLRLAAGHAFLGCLATPRFPDWHSGYERYLNGELELVESLSLLHSHWWPSPDMEEIQGKRLFEAAFQRYSGSCEATIVWGYGCDLPLADGGEFDHLFPYAYGGPTIAANRIRLCRWHNGAKGSDVHLYPWEQGEPAWLAAQLERIAQRFG